MKPLTCLACCLLLALVLVAANKPEPKPDPDAAAVFDARIDAAVRRETAKYVKALTAICKKAVKAKRLDKACEIVDQIALVDNKAAETVRKSVLKLHPIVGKWQIVLNNVTLGVYRFRPGGVFCDRIGGDLAKWQSRRNTVTVTYNSGTIMEVRVDGDVFVGTWKVKGRQPQAVTGKRYK